MSDSSSESGGRPGKSTSDTPRELGDEEINEAGPEATKQASSPLYATETPTTDSDDLPDRTHSEHEP